MYRSMALFLFYITGRAPDYFNEENEKNQELMWDCVEAAYVLDGHPEELDEQF